MMDVDSDGWLALTGVVIAVLLLALAALVETVVTRTSRARVLAALGMPPEPSGRQRFRLGTDPRHRLVAAMVLVQVVAAIVIAGLLTHVLNDLGSGGLGWLALLVAIAIYLAIGQILPRAIGEGEVEKHLDTIVGLGQTLSKVFFPLVWIVDRGVRLAKSWLHGSAAIDDFEEIDDNRPTTRMRDFEDIGEVDRQMIDGILGLENMTVRDIMVPRLDIIAVERSVPSDELITTITQAGHSRIPVYHGSVDRILGVLYAKDLLPFVIGTTRRIPLLDLIRPAFVVPESKKVNDLFAELKRARIHIAIVADEYGGTAGLVTIEDILEEIVGEIQDEYDSEEPLFEKAADNVLLADGRLPIEDVEDALRIRFEEDDDFGTLGGFVHKHLGRLPIQGDTFEAEGVRVEILKVERHRVRQLRITKLTDDGGRGSQNGAIEILPETTSSDSQAESTDA
jgi:CBS domain containing-hemolysin-like protein